MQAYVCLGLGDMASDILVGRNEELPGLWEFGAKTHFRNKVCPGKQLVLLLVTSLGTYVPGANVLSFFRRAYGPKNILVHLLLVQIKARNPWNGDSWPWRLHEGSRTCFHDEYRFIDFLSGYEAAVKKVGLQWSEVTREERRDKRARAPALEKRNEKC